VKPDIQRLRETFASPELAWLVERLRKRLENGSALAGIVTLSNPSPKQREAVDRLLGRLPSRGGTMSVPLESLEDLLRHAQICPSLSEAVQLLTGPIRNLRAERINLELYWDRLYSKAASRFASRPNFQPWLDGLYASGSLRRYGIQRAEILLNQAIDIVSRLPAKGISLSELAASTTGNAHALDPDTSLGAVVIRAAAMLGGVANWNHAEARRDAWAAAGVLCDELSAPVLTLRLRADTESVTGRALCLYADAGEPTFLSVRQLVKSSPVFSRDWTGPVVYICENPAVVSAAATNPKQQSSPLICTQGQPTTGIHVLLRKLTAAGIRLLYHGDFDWSGIQIANSILQRHNADPWRMTATEYKNIATKSLPLEGIPVLASWDHELTQAMKDSGFGVHEEQVIDTLVDDLCTGRVDN
jgi:uncharacterized protein (TIGR02679 family)